MSIKMTEILEKCPCGIVARNIHNTIFKAIVNFHAACYNLFAGHPDGRCGGASPLKGVTRAEENPDTLFLLRAQALCAGR